MPSRGALIRDPPVLLLDEATSALDAASEAGVQATLERIGRERTVVAVTHRLSQAVTADRIFMLDRGRLVEEGPHDELLAADGAYAQMWNKQTTFAPTAPSAHGQPARVQAHQLRRLPVVQDGDDESMAALAELFVTEHVPAGHVVYKEGDWGDRFYIIVWGVVELTRTDGTEAAVLHDGDHFGELAPRRGGRRQESVLTRAASEFLMLRRDQLLELRGRMPRLGAAAAPS